MKTKIVGFITGLALLVTLATATNLPLDVIAIDTCTGPGMYSVDVHAINNTDYGIHIDEATMVEPDGDTVYIGLMGIIPPRDRLTTVVTIPATQTGVHIFTVKGFIIETQEAVSDSSEPDISGGDHCPGGTPTSEPTPTETQTEPTATPTETIEPSVTPTLDPSVTATVTPEPSKTVVPSGTPANEGPGELTTPVFEMTPMPTVCPDCGPAVCEIGTGAGHVTEYESNISGQPAYLTVLTNGGEVPGGTSHVTADGTKVSFALGQTVNPLANLIANGTNVAFFNAPCSHCLFQWGNRRNPETGKLEVLFLDGGTKWDFAVAAAELLGMDIHNDDHYPILIQMAERASDLYGARPDHSISFIWAPIE